MDRTIYYAQSQVRTFDLQGDESSTLYGLAGAVQDILGGTTTVLSGFAATPTGPTSLTINLAAGRIYQLADADATSDGAIVQDLTQIFQQGFAASQHITFSTSGIGAGQSRYSLVQAQFSQVDSIRSGDPTGGLLLFYNAANPSMPYEGPGNDGLTSNTIRKGLVTIQVITGAAATTGSEVPPNPTSGWVPLYLVDLAFGQTTISSGQILTAGPSVGTGVPSNYTQAPFLSGLLNQHHLGTTGQAPQIDLTAEVKNILPLTNLPASSSGAGTGIPVLKLHAGNPNGSVAGNANVNSTSDLCYDTTNSIFYICTTTGSTSTAVWTSVATPPNVFTGGTTTGSANAQVLASLTPPAGFSLSSNGQTIVCTAGFTNTGAATLAVTVPSIAATSIKKDSGSGLVALASGDITAGDTLFLTVNTAGSCLVLTSGLALGTLAYANTDGTNFTVSGGNLAFGSAPVIPSAATATTQSPGNNTTKVATTAYADAIAALKLSKASNLSDLASIATAMTNLGFGSSAGASGWLSIPYATPIYIQWGAVGSVGSTSNITVNFSTTFPTACDVVFVQNTGTNITWNVSPITAKSTTQFTWQNNASNSQTGYYVAIGH